MEQAPTNLILRNDTILGVCQGIGDDFGFSPMLLRVPFAVCLLLNPYIVVGTYLGLGALVLASRLLYPNRRRGAAAVAKPAEAAEAPAQEALPIAA
jgi:phage shock protein C